MLRIPNTVLDQFPTATSADHLLAFKDALQSMYMRAYDEAQIERCWFSNNAILCVDAYCAQQGIDLKKLQAYNPRNYQLRLELGHFYKRKLDSFVIFCYFQQITLIGEITDEQKQVYAKLIPLFFGGITL